ncbi:glycosyltransferase family 25 protein [Pseudomonas sp. GX19020]|uniref:glycosyltransferase family 25 protein n=1 Tax=Pseudomonas sp. GX19020 TaxID=2942277 RepID=UPI002018F4EE|nr:glycosyltransferase family 25 protein [Pseudomonas sp. GX19020]MCL4068482.1 glycosyltransferase family 25 protein [Pseudomonas sp. GX19020]
MPDSQMLPDFGAWLINLPRSAQRRAAMEAQLSALNLPYSLHEATDGRAEWDRLVQNVDLPAFRRNVGREVLPGEIGCYHSHIAVWQAFLDSGKDVALVLEDDVVFHPEFMTALQTALAAKADWDFLKLNKIRAKQPLRQKKLGIWALNAYLGPATGLGAYLIRRDLAARLLPGMLPITRPIDHELDRVHIHDFRHYGLEPFPSHVDDGNSSTITGQSHSDVRKFPWYRRLPLYGLRLRNMIGKLGYLIRKGRFPAPKG